MSRRTWWQTALVVVGAFLSGSALWLVNIGFSLYEFSGSEEAALDHVMPYALREIPFAIVAMALLPKALRHDPREFEWHDPIPGTIGTLFAGLLVVAFGTATVLGGIAGLFALVSIVSRASTRWTIAAISATLVGSVLGMSFDPGSTYSSVKDVAFFLAAGAFASAVAMVIGQYRAKRRAHARFLRAEAETARVEERARIARDMHDTLSHRLSLIALHSGALEQLPTMNAAKQAEVAGVIKDQAAKAADDLRESLTILRAESADPRTHLSEVIEEARAAGQHIAVKGEPPELTATHQHLFHRVLTEGLTNARKHAPGKQVTVVFEPRSLTIVTDQAVVDKRTTGYGLVGVRERARLVGATIELKNDPHTLKVRLA